ncbi:MAG: DinB family protein [Gemmatimonadota bacterium]
MLDFAQDLRTTVEHASTVLSAMPPGVGTRRPGPGKWSPIEILGHLIDSASNNHQRFVRAQFREDLSFDGYAQDEWVTAQSYRAATWSEVVDLWRAFNLHLAHVMEQTPTAELRRPRADHNLHQIGWELVSPDEPTTLEYFMRDYVGHLKHHLQQIDPGLCDPPRSQRAPNA